MEGLVDTDYLDSYLQASACPDNIGSLNMTLYICYGIEHSRLRDVAYMIYGYGTDR